MSDDVKQFAPAAARNAEPIAAVLRRVLPERGVVLEIASGTGQHAAHFAAAFPGLTWQPSDIDERNLGSVRAWRAEAGLANLVEPVRLDARDERWPVERADAILCANMIHIAPWEACQGLIRGAGRVLPPGGVLILYGPYILADRDTAPSNLRFDASLRATDPTWGVRALADVEREAVAQGLLLREVVDMPANNVTVVFARR